MATELFNIYIWVIAGITLFGIIVLTLCTCWCLKSNKWNRSIYSIEDEGCSKRSFIAIDNFNIYRRFNSTEKDGILEDEKNAEADLTESFDISQKFSNSLLRMNSQADEMFSCISADSFATLYSNNLSRSNSKRSYISCFEASDNGDLV